MPHTNFPKVTWVIFVKVDPVVVHASSIPAAAWVLAVLTDAAMAVVHVAPEFPGLPQSGWHGGGRKGKGRASSYKAALHTVGDNGALKEETLRMFLRWSCFVSVNFSF